MIIGARLRSAALIAGVMSSALAFYMVSLRVASERSAVEKLERRIASNMMNIRQLQGELGTRERLPQLERWNADVLALSAPKAGQYLDGAVELAAFATDRMPGMDARLQQAIADGAQAPKTDQVQTVAYASADTGAKRAGQPVVTFAAERDDDVAQPLLRTASYKPQSQPRRQASASVMSDSVIAEIRDAAAVEAAGLRQAGVR